MLRNLAGSHAAWAGDHQQAKDREARVMGEGAEGAYNEVRVHARHDKPFVSSFQEFLN
ncbi:hypothetical protein SB778_09575 [Paraburkholderia sp. SIMBA_050]